MIDLGTPAAVFDVDRTLVRGGTERLFFRYLLARRKLSLVRVLRFLLSLAANPRHRFTNKSYLAGMAVPEAERWASACYRELILPRLRPRAVARLQAHHAGGRRIVLITGSLDFLVHPLKENLRVDTLIATVLESRQGIFTGNIKGLHPRGENKRLLLKELARREGLDLARSYGYGDHEEDIPFLSCVGYPVVANPTRKMARLARQRGWPCEYF
ncbi:MAG: HAD family hydrolase [Desulfobaccales bacterium]